MWFMKFTSKKIYKKKNIKIMSIKKTFFKQDKYDVKQNYIFNWTSFIWDSLQTCTNNPSKL